LKRSRKAEDETKGREVKGKHKKTTKMKGRIRRRGKKQKNMEMWRETRKLNLTYF
jgi:hypothetical protein